MRAFWIGAFVLVAADMARAQAPEFEVASISRSLVVDGPSAIRFHVPGDVALTESSTIRCGGG
jgi:hypothetical protein